MLTTVDVPETACDRFQQGFSIRHIIVAVESTLSSDITQSYDRTIFCNSVQFLGRLDHFMERYSRNIQCLVQHSIVKVIISTFLAHVRRHTDRVQYKVNLSAQYIHRCLEYIRQIFHTSGICRHYLTV